MLLLKSIPTLQDLPTSPPGKTGWPWTEQSEPLPEKMPDGSEWPRISIVTPSYNQGQYIEETIRSVLLQGYPNLEYIVIDGYSTDNSVEVIKKYQTWLTYWKSERDNGQCEAINKGFMISSGAVMGWLNSDDLLTKDAFHYLAAVYKPGLNWWTGKAKQLLANGTLVNIDNHELVEIPENYLLHAKQILYQVATFWNRELWNETGSSLGSFNLAMDYELWLRFSKISSAISIDQNLGIFRTHSEAKTSTTSGMIAYLAECDDIRRREYYQKKHNFAVRAILINFWTRFYLAQKYDWRSWLGRRSIPYI